MTWNVKYLLSAESATCSDIVAETNFIDSIFDCTLRVNRDRYRQMYFDWSTLTVH